MWQGLPWPWPIVRIPWDVLTNATDTSCSSEHNLGHLLDVVVLTSAAFLVVFLNLIHSRKWSNWISTLLNGAIPVDFLSRTPYRLIYCVTLSLWAVDTFHDSLNSELFYRSDDAMVDALLYFGVTPIVIILRQALIYFPIISCVDSSIPLLGHFLGFIYTLLVGVRSVYAETVVIRGCSSRGHLVPRDVSLSLCVMVPVYVGYVGVAFWFFCCAAMETVMVIFTSHKIRKTESSKYEVHTQHVRKLLRKVKKYDVYHSKISVLQNWIRGFRYVMPYKLSPHVKFPLPFLAALCMSFALLYQICILVVSREQIFMGHVIEFIDSFSITLEALKDLFPQQALQLENLFYDIKGFAQMIRVLLPLAHWTGGILTVFFTAYLIQNFHKHQLRIARGDLSFLVASEPLPSLKYSLASAMRYIPFQVGHIIVCFFVYSLITIFLGLIGWGYYYLFKNHQFYGVHYWSWAMVPYLWASALHTLQLLLCKYVFLTKQDRACRNGNYGVVVSIRFRPLYMLVTYLILFFDVCYSIAMCILRVLGPFIFTAVTLFRLDRDVYMRGLEGWDIGHRTYVGYLYLEYSTNNAVLVTFVNLLIQSLHANRQREYQRVELATPTRVCSVQNLSGGTGNATEPRSGEGLNDEEGVGESDDSAKDKGNQSSGYMALPDDYCPSSWPVIRSKRACNRWRVAYTLVRNPGLQHLTANRIKQGLDVEQLSISEH